MCAEIVVTPSPLSAAAGVADSASSIPTPSTATGASASTPSGASTAEGSGTTSFTPESAGPSTRVFSPTGTEEWLRCPMLRALKRRFRLRAARSYATDMVLGRLVHAGLAAFYTGLDAATEVAKVAEAEWTDDLELPRDSAITLALKAVYVATHPPVTHAGNEAVVGTEVPIGETRIDLVTRGASGLIVTDFKTKRQLPSDIRVWERTVAEFHASHQVRHEAWAAQAMYGEPVVGARIQLIVLAPKPRAEVIPVSVTPERIARWLHHTAEPAWRDMAEEEKGERPVAMRLTECVGKFGRCEMHDFCHLCEGDWQRAEALYEEIQ